MADAIDALIGQKCGNYELESILGAGGMGTVYAAVQPTLNKRVAIKVLRPELAGDRKAVGRLIDEARATSAIGHRNIVEVFDIGETAGGLTYLAMEALEGQTLQEMLDLRGRLSPHRAVRIARQICGALGAAHRQGIIHRDLKPQNIFLVPDDGVTRVKVLDFGAAKLMDAFNRASPATATGAIIGTPFYMAPEQARGMPVDGRTDIYALGVILYRALTGVLPYKGETFTEVLARLLTEEPPSPSQTAPEARIPARLEQLIIKAMAKEPAARHADMERLEADLAAFEEANPAPQQSSEVDTRAMEQAATVAGTPQELMAGPLPDSLGPPQPEPRPLPRLPTGPHQPSPAPAARPDVSIERSRLVESAVLQAEGKVSRRMLWLRLLLYPSLVGFLLLGYHVLLWRGVAVPGLNFELWVVGLSALPVAYGLEIAYYLTGKHHKNPRSLHLILITCFVVVGTYALQLNGSLTNYMVVFYAIVISFTRIRLDNRAAIFATTLSVGCFLCVVVLEFRGNVPYARMLKSIYSPTLTSEIAFAVVISVGAVAFLLLAHLGAHVLVKGLEAREDALSEVTRGLEGQVAEQIEVLRRRERLRHFLPAQVVESVVQGDNEVKVGYARRKISLVACILDDFFETTTKLEPEEQTRILNELYGGVARVADRFGAVVDSFSGAGVTLLVGVPRRQDDAAHAAAAVRIGLGVIHHLAELLPGWQALGAGELQAKVGVHTCYAAVGNFGSEAAKLQYTAVGASTKLAERAARLATVGGVVATQATRMLCAGSYTFEECGEVDTVGPGEAVAVFRVEA